MKGMWSPNTHVMISQPYNRAFIKYSPLLQSVIFNSLIDNQPFRKVLPKIAMDLNEWMIICSSFIDQMIGFEMKEAFVSDIQIVI